MERNVLPGLTGFLAVATHGGLNAASRASGVPKATLSRQVRALEEALGTRLLERGGRQLGLTEEGRLLFERAAPLVAELDTLHETISGRGETPSGRLRISVPALFAQTAMGAIAATFVARHPEVTLDIEISDSFVDPVRDGYDMVIRVNPSPNSDLVGKCFLKTDMVLAAPPGMRRPEKSGARTPAVILSAQAAMREWTVVGPTGELRIVPDSVMTCSSMMIVHEAARSGAGAALLPRWLIEEDLARGRLNLWGVAPNRQIEAWVLHTSSRLTSLKVRLFVDLLVESYAG